VTGLTLDTATMATVAAGPSRQFGPDHLVTAQMMRLNIATGHLQWVNAGHPAPLLIRNHQVVRQLTGPTTLPVGFGREEPRISEQMLQHGDRVLCFTDGLNEEHEAGEEQFGEEQLIHWANRIDLAEKRVRAVVRALSYALKQQRGGRTSDDATLV
jgi:serine phosphatase RsbU (regulator of sigma subunit)